MNELILKQKTKPTTNEKDDLSLAKKKSEMKKKQIKLKINYHINQINVSNQNSLVNKILDEIKKETNSDTLEVNHIVNKEIHKQENNFKYKLAQKRSIIPVKKKHSELILKIPNEVNLVEHRMKRSFSVKNRYRNFKESKFQINDRADVKDTGIQIQEETKSEISEKQSVNQDGKENHYNICSSSSEKEEDNIIMLGNNFDNYEEKKINELDEIFKKIETQEKNVTANHNQKKNNNLNDDNGKVINSQNNSRPLTSKDLNTSLFKIDESV
jgi:hypothetical protein